MRVQGRQEVQQWPRLLHGWGGVGWHLIFPPQLRHHLDGGGLSAAFCLIGETVPRSKRRCVLERKQPYSGDEWCSGPESEDDDKSLGSSHSECPQAQA